MIGPDSRYREGEILSAPCHDYDADAEVVLDDTGNPTVEYRETVYLLPAAQVTQPPYEAMAKETDTMWLLAHRQLGNPQRWWVVADANPHIRYPLDLKMGDTIFLPE